jgi:hypothetical protein
LVWATPVFAVAVVIATVLSLTLGSSSATSTSTPGSNAGAAGTSTTSAPGANARTTDLTGTYVGVGHNNSLTMFLELTQSGSSLTGTLIVNGSHYSPTLGDKPAHVTGKVDLASKSFSASAPTFGLSFSGKVSGASLDLSIGEFGDPEETNVLNIVFQRGTVSEFQRLTEKTAPSVANPQVNLVNAMTAVRALYRVAQNYRFYGVTFETRAPEFIWTAKQCKAPNCISYHLLDVASSNDAQGLALAVYSPATSTCWYAIDIETTPRIVSNDLSAFVASAGDPNASVKQPGVYYARSPVGSAPSFCIASLVVRAKSATWGNDYANAGGLS